MILSEHLVTHKDYLPQLPSSLPYFTSCVCICVHARDTYALMERGGGRQDTQVLLPSLAQGSCDFVLYQVGDLYAVDSHPEGSLLQTQGQRIQQLYL